MGVLVTFSDKFAEVQGIKEIINPGQSIMYAYIGLVAGDLLSGYLSQLLRSRKKW